MSPTFSANGATPQLPLASENNEMPLTNYHTQIPLTGVNWATLPHTYTRADTDGPRRHCSLLIVSSTCCFVRSLSQFVSSTLLNLNKPAEPEESVSRNSTAPSSSNPAASLGWELSRECPLLLCCTHPGPVPVNASWLRWALMLASARERLCVCSLCVCRTVRACAQVCVNSDRQPARVLICSRSDSSPKGQAVSSVSLLRRALQPH